MRAAPDGKVVAADNITYKLGGKMKKNVEVNLGRLTAEPFPLIESRKRVSDESNKEVPTPLYDVVSGKTVQLRYARVGLSELGKIYTKHYKNREPEDGGYYKSIVPVSLLKRNAPWSTGHRSDMIPLNPEELFKIMVYMLENNTYEVPADFLAEHFRGFDVGPEYTVYLTSKALKTLYAAGEASVYIVPDIEIDRDSKILTIKAPPYTTTTHSLAIKLLEMISNGLEPFRTFHYGPNIKDYRKGLQIPLLKINGTDEEIKRELFLCPEIARKFYIRHEILRYSKKESKKLEKKDIKTDTNISLLTVNDLLELFSKQELDEMGFSHFINKFEASSEPENNADTENADESDLNWDKNIYTTKEEVVFSEYETLKYNELILENYNIIQNRVKDKTYNEYLVSARGEAELLGMDVSENTDPFMVDLVPVFETLWNCIKWEIDNYRIDIREQINDLSYDLEKNILLEKATRPEVAKVINELNMDELKHTKLAELCYVGSELLPEGFTMDEIRTIYKRNANEVLPKLAHRKDYISEYERLLKAKQDLLDKLEDDEQIRKEIAEELRNYIKSRIFRRKSKVKFFREEEKITYLDDTRLLAMTYNRNWENNEDIPISLYIEPRKNLIRKSYGVNINQVEFQPAISINCLAKDRFAYFFFDAKSNKIKASVINPMKLPGNAQANLMPFYRGLLPVNQPYTIFFWTNKNKYFILDPDKSIYNSIKLDPDESIVGWETIYPENKYLYMLTKSTFKDSYGIQIVDFDTFKRFKHPSKLWDNLGKLVDVWSIGDPEIEDIGLFIHTHRGTLIDNQTPPSTRIYKPRTSHPTRIMAKVAFPSFSRHLEFFVNGLYLWDPTMLPTIDECKHTSNKRPWIMETSYVQQWDDTSKKYKKLVEEVISNRKNNKDAINRKDRLLVTISRNTGTYEKLDLNQIKDLSPIDGRVRKNLKFNNEEIMWK